MLIDVVDQDDRTLRLIEMILKYRIWKTLIEARSQLFNRCNFESYNPETSFKEYSFSFVSLLLVPISVASAYHVNEREFEFLQ